VKKLVLLIIESPWPPGGNRDAWNNPGCPKSPEKDAAADINKSGGPSCWRADQGEIGGKKEKETMPSKEKPKGKGYCVLNGIWGKMGREIRVGGEKSGVEIGESQSVWETKKKRNFAKT